MKKKNESESSSNKPDRKTIERNRRINMKNLCFKLVSLIPHQHPNPSSKDIIISQHEQLDLAANYIKHLTERVSKLKTIKEQVTKSTEAGTSSNTTERAPVGLRLPVVELRDSGSSIEVIVISGLKKNFMLHEVITILEEEGAEVVNASFSTIGDKVFHSVHAQVKISRVGVETSRVCQRLQEITSRF
ncbi:hypothetical protein SLA2020_209390 [Shorea laevis]